MGTTITDSIVGNHEQLRRQVWQLLGSVCDPEVPVLSIVDLGIVRDVIITGSLCEIIITPTYTGCPAMDVIRINIRMELLQAGINDFTIREMLSPAWTTAWMTEEGKQKLKAYGIAPPQYQKPTTEAFAGEVTVPCPQCNSTDTKLVAEFGSTSCKSLYQCNTCKEPFDYFKCH